MEIEDILVKCHTIAVVGLSADPSRPSYRVAHYLKEHGYRVIPVNPEYKEVLDEVCYPDLASVPEPIDLVDIFRRSEHVQPIVDAAAAVGTKVVWMQEGVVNEEAANHARNAGMEVVMDRCIMKEHHLLGRWG